MACLTVIQCSHNMSIMDDKPPKPKRIIRAVHLSESDYATISEIAAGNGISRSKAAAQAIALLVKQFAKRNRKEVRPWDGSSQQSSQP